MVGRVLLAALLSAVLMFLWGFVFWGVLNLGAQFMEPLPAELDVLAALRNVSAESGMYVYPMPAGMEDQAAQEQFQTLHEEGPILQMAYRAEGSDPMPSSTLLLGFVHFFVIALLAASLLAMLRSALPGYGRRVGVVLLVSLVAAFWANSSDAIWWMHSPKYALGNSAYMLGAGLLMALVTAALVRQTPKSSSTPTP